MPGKRKKVMTKAQKAKLRSRSGAAVTQAELARIARIKKALKKITPKLPAGTGGGFAGAKAGASIGKLHKGKVGKMTGSAVTESEKKRLKKAIKRRK